MRDERADVEDVSEDANSVDAGADDFDGGDVCEDLTDLGLAGDRFAGTACYCASEGRRSARSFSQNLLFG